MTCHRVAPCSRLVLLACLAVAASIQLSEPDDVEDLAFDQPQSGRKPRMTMDSELPPINLNVTALRHIAGEAAVGASAGAVAAWAVQRLQSTILLVSILGSVGAGAALHLRWLTPEQARVFGAAALRFVQRKLAWLAHKADLDGDGEVTLDDSQMAYSRVAPLVRRRPTLSGGAVAGFVVAWSAMR